MALKPDTADLKQVVRILASAEKPLNDRQHQLEISFDEPSACLLVSGLCAADEVHHLLIRQRFQLSGVDAADLYLSLHAPSSCV